MNQVVNDQRIISVEWATMEGCRPRSAGSNARLGEHGSIVRPAFARLTTESGVSGFGFCRATPQQAQRLVGRPLHDLFSPDTGAMTEGLPFDLALWDLAGQLASQPVYRLVAATRGLTVDEPLLAPCYDTSLYIDDLHLPTEDEAAALIAAEAKDGYARGHRSFKIKVGRGARHMPTGRRRPAGYRRHPRRARCRRR